MAKYKVKSPIFEQGKIWAVRTIIDLDPKRAKEYGDKFLEPVEEEKVIDKYSDKDMAGRGRPRKGVK